MKIKMYLNWSELSTVSPSITRADKSGQEPFLTLFLTAKEFLNLRQGKHQTVTEYYERYVAARDVNATLGTDLFICSGVVSLMAAEESKDVATLTDADRTSYITAGRERLMAIHMLMNSDQERFKTAIDDLKHMHLMGKGSYPKTLHECYTRLDERR